MIDRTFYASTFVRGDGATRTFPFSFAGVNTGQASGTKPYLYDSDVKVQEIFTENGIKKTVQRDVILDMPNQATIVGPPVVAGREIRIYRETELRFPLVDYRDLQSVSEHDLDLANRQAVFIAQETRDAAGSNILQDNAGNYNAMGRRIVNLAPGIAPTDAVNVSQLNRMIRVDDMDIPALPKAADRVNRMLTFDADGNPRVVVPAAGSIGDFGIQLMGESGAGMVGYRATDLENSILRTVMSKLRQRVDMDDFAGATDRDKVTNGLAALAKTGGGTLWIHRDFETDWTLKLGTNVVIAGPPWVKIKAKATGWGPNPRKIITNADFNAGNTGCGVLGLTIEGIYASGSEWDSGIHFCRVTHGSIQDTYIKNCRGDGVTLGAAISNQTGRCEHIRMLNVTVRKVDRMGVALTGCCNSEFRNVRVFDLADSVVGGCAFDLEPNYDGDVCFNNRFYGGGAWNCKEGIALASRASLNNEDIRGNLFQGMVFMDIKVNAVKSSYTGASFLSCHFERIGAETIIQRSSKGVQEVSIIGCYFAHGGQNTPLTFPVIRLMQSAHCNVSNNTFGPSPMSLALIIESSVDSNGSNVFYGNNGRAAGAGKTYRIEGTGSRDSHNTSTGRDASAIPHDGFTARGDIIMDKFDIVMSRFKMNTTQVISVSAAPSDQTGAIGDIAWNSGTTSGQTLLYRKLATGRWHALTLPYP